MLLVIKLDELCWLKNGSMWIPYYLKLNSPSASGISWWAQEQLGCQGRGTRTKGRRTGWRLPEVQGTVLIVPRSKRCHTGKRFLFVGQSIQSLQSQSVRHFRIHLGHEIGWGQGDESESAKIVLKQVKWTFIYAYLWQIMWNHAKKSMEGSKLSDSVFLQWDARSSVLKTHKKHKK